MSAFVALFDRRGAPVAPELVDRMLEAVPEHAVDGSSRWASGEIALGHQRFWVLPEEVGEAQPLHDGESGCALVADARLDNRPELLRALAPEGGEGPRWSDSRLLLAAYLRWGASCVDHLLGDFAFAVWDPRRRTLFAARDPLGNRGLSTFTSESVHLLATNPEQILAHPSVTARIHEARVADFLTADWSNREETFLHDVHDLPPGHSLTATPDRVERREFCNLLPPASIRYRDPADYAGHFRELVTEAVRCRLRSTGRIGLSLSGGLDSPFLGAIAAPLLAGASHGAPGLACYSYAFERHAACDERRFIEPLVADLGVDSRYAWCDDLWTFRDLDRWPVHRGFVLSDPYAWLPQAVMRLAQQDGCRVLLGGYYGDVLTAGGHAWAAGMLEDRRYGEVAHDLWTQRHGMSFIPSLYVATDELVRFAPSDPALADVDGDGVPDVPIGRLPVRTGAELAALLEKTEQYGRRTYDATAVISADLGFGGDAEAFVDALPGPWTVERGYLDRMSAESAKALIKSSINRGAALTGFVGHSGPTVWTYRGLFSAADALSLTNAGRPTLVSQWGCWNSYYVEPRYNTMAHALLVAGNKGAAAVLGTTTVSSDVSERQLGTALIPFLTQPGTTIGAALQMAKRQVAAENPAAADVLLGWTILGDPTLVITP